MRTSNPAMKANAFQAESWADTVRAGITESRPGVMSMQGTVLKTAFLLCVCILSALAAAHLVSSGRVANGLPLLLIGGFGSFAIGIALFFAPKASAFLAPVYAVLEGLFLGTVSLLMAARFGDKGAVMVTQAVGLTFGVFVAMLGAYATGLIRASPTFKKVIVIATMGICLTYLASFLLGLFGVTFMMPLAGSGLVGIGFSIVVVGVAALNLVLDFDMVENGVRNGAEKHWEWYAGYAMLVTLVWLYLEILRLLSKLNRR